MVLTAAPGTMATASAASAASPTFTVSVGSIGTFPNPMDTPASPYIDKDGTFYYQESASLYGTTDPHEWQFYSGTDFDTATLNTTISDAVNPSNSSDANDNTVWRCENSPTGLTATAGDSSYPLTNYCDLVGTWVDPDTGDWYGLVHDEFTGEPFGDGLHYDSIDYAVSHDQGMTWTIEGHAITSPYSTTRGDTTAFPNQTYDYGDGDPRLYVDQASGYFYMYYASRIVPKGGDAGSVIGLAHVARCPISAKMATGCWQKWYDGAWSQPGVGGMESNMVPVDSTDPSGYTSPSQDYNPANTGTTDQQVAAGELPSDSYLGFMNITYDAYLGLYIGEPETWSVTSQRFYATSDLATQKWTLIGDSGSYTSDSWYRWFVDSVNKTSSEIVGESFRSYCSIACNSSDGEYANETIGSSDPAALIYTAKTYTLANGDGRVLAQVSGSSATTSDASATGSLLESWAFAPDGDGSYRIVNASTGQALGVDSGTTTQRAWGTAPTVTALAAGGPTVGQQWFVLPDTDVAGTYRIVNRYSGLVIGLSGVGGRLAETTPARSWTDTSGSSVGDGRTAAEQTLTLTPIGAARESVLAVNPGNQKATVGTAVSLQLSATDSAGHALTYTATGLPAGLSISASGLVSGTPTKASTGSTVTVTASSGTASGTMSFSWVVNPVTPNFTGTHTLDIGAKGLDDPDGSTTDGTALTTAHPRGAADNNWVFTQQADGSYEIASAASDQCASVNYGSTAAGESIVQWPCSDSTNQEWDVVLQPNGTYSVTSVRSGLLLTTASKANGAAVTQEADTGSVLQQWSIE
ncbi:RICIN domain-containing protein [Actinospica durhamensis]|uniref:RICIN domain-containing protein n=1 Tax=Actinospica durhamensis TaxID=1508375 RepID=UPI001FE4D366